MTVEHFKELVKFHMQLHQQQRFGQAVFNTLKVHDPEAAEDLRCSSLDPFNHDDRVPAVMQWLIDRQVLTYS